MSLSAELLVHRGDFTLDARLRVAPGETLALLGPNGSGKSTLLAAIAGLLALSQGTVQVNDRLLTKVESSSRTVSVAAHARRIGLLGQDPLLFPHLSALENVAFSARARGLSVARARESAAELLNAVGMEGFESRLPSQLSGGQQQRVAIARALAAEPEVLLLDEPMAALDVHNASAVRTLLRERLRASDLPTIVVSHDVVDAVVLADRVAIMAEGRIVAYGPPDVVLGQPNDQFTANLVGLNLLHGTLGPDGTVNTADGRRVRGRIVDSGVDSGMGSDTDSGENAGADAGVDASVDSGADSRAPRAGERVIAAFPPEAMRVSVTGFAAHHEQSGLYSAGEDPAGEDPAGGFTWQAKVGTLEPAVRGIRVPFIGENIFAELTTAETLAFGVREGATVTVSVDSKLVTVYRPQNATATMQG